MGFVAAVVEAVVVGSSVDSGDGVGEFVESAKSTVVLFESILQTRSVETDRDDLEEELLDQQDERGSEKSLKMNQRADRAVSFDEKGIGESVEGAKTRRKERRTNHHDSIDVHPVAPRRANSCPNDGEYDPGEDDLEQELEPAEDRDEELRIEARLISSSRKESSNEEANEDEPRRRT